MNIKELIEEVERLKETKRKNRGGTLYNYCRIKLRGIKQTVEAVDKDFVVVVQGVKKVRDWLMLKKLLGVK